MTLKGSINVMTGTNMSSTTIACFQYCARRGKALSCLTLTAPLKQQQHKTNFQVLVSFDDPYHLFFYSTTRITRFNSNYEHVAGMWNTYISKCNYEARLWKSHDECIIDFVTAAVLEFEVVRVLNLNRQKSQQPARRGVHLKRQIRVRAFPENAPS